MSEIKTPDILIERAVELWCRMLKRPVFDNGDSSMTSGMASVMAGMNNSHNMAQVDDYDAAIERFREILTKRLKFLRDHNGEPTGKMSDRGHGPERYWFSHSLSCDYHPDCELAEAAAEAGIPESAFSWKTDVTFYGTDCVSVSAGYAAPSLHHYPVLDGQWLVCELQGRDMPKIIDAVRNGRLPEFELQP